MILLSYVLYYLGHLLYLLTDALADWPRCPEWLVDAFYRAYSKLMGWSIKCDRAETVWLSRHDSEAEEEFWRRVDERWPDRE